ncbi:MULTISPECIES: response regulator [unclassified Siphonobacter]|uniref:response regulator n=1 Tax=unclassified Siphonobacter TaxID=2635712 RepID=UPI000CC6867D|nr:MULTISPECIES: response regulator [unclassified Siphonobacter]MDQ1086749.1 CheY-like chemotaxis protein [Siphonobacter sp. SORGH_AS_1065]MDR6197012.1 CheY-like chemotaxis protein [Siphonobacter sp. SORGH_AS_0500]PKK36257.1 two-component system response regulator [Siphonobacter sp. SORGH_AS_0500]
MNTQIPILVADDDEDDRFLIKTAFRDSLLVNDIFFVADGVELMQFLHNEGAYADRGRFPRPGIIFLDLNMPRKDGWEALTEIKQNPDLKAIPVVVLTTSNSERDILKTYESGANCYITKPISFDQLLQIVKSFGQFWLNIASVPGK